MSTSTITLLEIIPMEILCIIIANVPKKISDWKQLFLVCKDFLVVSYEVLKSSPDTICNQYFVTKPEIVHFNQVFGTILTNAPVGPCPKLATLFRHPLFISQELIKFMITILFDANLWIVREILNNRMDIKYNVSYPSDSNDICIAWIAAEFGLFEHLKYGIRNMGRNDSNSIRIFNAAVGKRQPKALEILIARFDLNIDEYENLRRWLLTISIGTKDNKKRCRTLLNNQIKKLKIEQKDARSHKKPRFVIIISDEE